MWPKLFMQLFELMPHLSRLVPIAERYFAAKGVADTTNEAALAALAEDMRGDLSHVAKAHQALYRQLQDQGNQIAELAVDLRTARSFSEQQERRLAALEQKLDSMDLWLKVGVGLITVLLVLVVILLVRGH